MNTRIEELMNLYLTDVQNHPEDVFNFRTVHGYKGLIQRNEMYGYYCGYIYLPENHRDYDKEFNDLGEIKVYGGVTWAENGEIGFDCNHGLIDFKPLGDHIILEKTHFMTFEMVKTQLELMSDQFKKRE